MRGRDLLTREDLAQELGVSGRTVNRLWAQRKLARTRVGRFSGTRPIDLEKFKQRNTQQAL
jgi:DeoR/GlpR family transcriptional regulator of sugar metabolism